MEANRHHVLSRTLRDEPSFRLRQTEEALYSGHFRSWDAVSVLPERLRSRIADILPWSTLSMSATLYDRSGNSWKSLFRTVDNFTIEAVLMRNARGQLTVCVSTQIGCAMNCAFCATGKMGLSRNLSADEIVDQVRCFRDYVEDESVDGEITNVVFMGMGEPLANYEAVRDALRILIDRMGIGMSRITVSTVGILPTLYRLLDDPEWPNIRLAISLHAADESVRRRIMPSTREGFLKDLVSFSEAYGERFPERRRHLTLEYLMLAGVNDSIEDAKCLVRLARRMGRIRVNLIPYNTTDSGFSGSNREAVSLFREILERAHITVTIRRSLGGDIAAACGQLAGKHKAKDEKRQDAENKNRSVS